MVQPVVPALVTANENEPVPEPPVALSVRLMPAVAVVVEIDTADGNQAVIKSGLKAGQVVVSAGVHVLSPGQKVSYYQEKMAAPVTASPSAK